MKNILFYAIVLLSVTATFNGCTDKDEYDINWPQPVITEVSSYSQPLSSTITLKGDFKKLKGIYFGEVAGDNLKIASDGASLTVDVPRTIDPDGAVIVAVNDYSQRYQTSQKFVPIIPATTVTKVSDIQSGLSFVIEGTNVDLLSGIYVNGTEVSFATKGRDKAVISVAGVDLNPGGLATVTFNSLNKDEIPTFDKVNIVYQFITYKEVVIWDFADGTHDYIGEPTASVKTGDVLGKEMNYFSLRAPGHSWDLTGSMTSEVTPDISGLVNPYLTFAVRTPEGSAGYFQMEDLDKNWRHFNYIFETKGEWIIISQPLFEGWGNGDLDIANFKPTLGFKAGNAGSKEDVDLAYVKITEGKYDGSVEIGDALSGSTKPNFVNVMNFDDASEWPDLFNDGKKIGSLGFRNEIGPFNGNGFFTFIDDDAIGGWGAYWNQPLVSDMATEDLSAFDNPFLSFALNTIDSKQMVMIKISQYDGALVLVKKFDVTTSQQWQTFQFALFQTDMENWSDDSTPLGAHYKTLKRLNPDVAIDKIEVIAGRSDNHPMGMSIDEVVITEGPRY